MLLTLLAIACGPGTLSTGGLDPTDAPLESVPGVSDVWPEGLCRVAMDCDETIVDDPKIDCALTIWDADGATRYVDRAAVELRGRSSLSFPKSQYSLELRGEAGVTVMPEGWTWRYLDTGEDPDEGWMELDFDDSDWGEGPAPLGYSDDPATEISYGGDSDEKHPASFFRARFYADTDVVPRLELALQRDDGAVVHLNGQEIVRSNVASGEVDADTWSAALTDDESRWRIFDVDPTLLIDGANQLAASAHQVDGSSSDMRLDAALRVPGAERAVDLFGMGGESDWILNGNYADRSLIRNKLFYDTFQAFGEGGYAAESVFCELEVNGELAGLYTLGESIKRDADRLDLAASGDGASFIIELGDDGFWESNTSTGAWSHVYPREEGISEAARWGIEDALLGWELALLGDDYADPEAGIFAWVDMDSAIDFVLINELAMNVDAYQLSAHVWRNDGGLLGFTPWDMDLSAGGYPDWDCDAEGFLTTYVERPLMIQRMAEVPAFQEALAARWSTLRAGPLAEEALNARIDAYLATMGDAVDRNFEIWSFEAIDGGGGVLDSLCDREDHDAEIAALREWLGLRLAWMDANIEAFAEAGIEDTGG